jgi:hypothetical protein
VPELVELGLVQVVQVLEGPTLVEQVLGQG